MLPDAMVHRKISNDMTERALYLLMEAGWEVESTAEALGVSARTCIERWEENYIAHSCANPPRSFMGRPKLLTADTIEIYRSCFVRIPLFFLTRSRNGLLSIYDQLILTTTLHMNLQDLTLTHKRLMRWRLNMTMLTAHNGY